MLGFGNSNRTVRLFADQFEAQPDGSYLYRKNMQEAAVRISSEERNQFIAAFTKARRRLIFGLIAIIVFGIATLALLFPNVDDTSTQIAIWLLVIVSIVAFVPVWRSIWSAPAIALERRPTEGLPLSPEQARRAAVARTSWKQWLGIFVACLLSWLHFMPDRNHANWWNIWIIAGLALAGLFIFRFAQKWRLSRTEHDR